MNPCPESVKRFLFFLPLLLGLVLLKPLPAKEHQRENPPAALELKLFLKPEYSGEEKIECRITLKNNSPKPLLLNQRMLINHPSLIGELNLELSSPPGPEGKLLEFLPKLKALLPEKTDFKALPPQGQVELSFDLSWFFRLEKAGDYQLKAVYQNDFAGPESSPWRGKISSIPVKFNLKAK